MATEIDKAKDELHARIEALDAYNEKAWNSTVDGIQDEALRNKRHISELFETVKKIKLKGRVLDKVTTKYSSDLVEARHRIESLEYEARILLNSQELLGTCPQTWQGVHELVV